MAAQHLQKGSGLKRGLGSILERGINSCVEGKGLGAERKIKRNQRRGGETPAL